MSRRRSPGETEVVGDAPPVVRARTWCLEADDTPPLTTAADRVSLGSVEGNDVVLGDRSVSRFHAELTRAERGYRVRDLGSTNGTFVDGLRVFDALLDKAVTLTLGRVPVRFHPGGDDAPLALSRATHFGQLLGQSVPMRRLFDQLERLARTQVTVLVHGESGTGKEHVARALHEHGPRKAGPLVVVDCGSIPPELIESELFGHEKGAFTGASSDRRGAFETAKGGTLFLDEIGELPLAMQPRLLRALEAKQVKRVGTDTWRPVDVRVIAATHRDLREAVNRRQFREDLYFRLAVAAVHVPPLREHLDDLPLLLEALWGRAHIELGLPPRPYAQPSEETLRQLERMPWEGNVRELRNFVERSLAFSGDLEAPPPARKSVAPRAAPPSAPVDARSYGEARDELVAQFEREFLAERLARAGGNVSRLAREARMDRAYAIKLLHKHGLR